MCVPASDVGFAERVRHVVAQDRWDVDSPEGIALVEAVLRQSYPLATVHGHGVSAAHRRRTVVLDVFRDGAPGAADPLAGWIEAVYERSAAGAYRAVCGILGEGRAAESVVEQAFCELRRSQRAGSSIEEGASSVEAVAVRLARAATGARGAAPDSAEMNNPPGQAHGPDETPAAQGSLRRGSVRRVLSTAALKTLVSAQREALELALLEDLKVGEVAERMQISSSAVHRHLRDALLAVDSGVPVSTPAALERWREANRSWALLPKDDRARPSRALEVAHAWLDYQTVSGGVAAETVVLITDQQRRFVATSGNAGQAFGRPSVAGLRIDDVTAHYARPQLEDLWSLFDAVGGMQGEYDCERPAMAPVRFPFRGVWGRPVPELQVGYLRPPVPVVVADSASL